MKLKSITFLAILCLSTTLFGQQSFKNSLDEKVFELKQFLLSDFKEIKSFYPSIDCFEFQIEIDTDTKLLEAFRLDGYADTNRVDSLIVWAPLEAKVKSIFQFNPSVEAEEYALFSFSMFRVELNEEVLKNEVKFGKKALAEKCKFMIRPNAKFSLTLNEFACKPSMTDPHVDSFPKKTIKSQLRGMKSDVFMLDSNYYLYFIASSTSTDEGCPCELKAFVYYKNEDVADLLSNPSTQGSAVPMFKLKERLSWRNEGEEQGGQGYFHVDMDLKFK